ncbi:MAG: lecithin retinol acyltransferase family protein [Cocleimonas sp.]
MDNYFGKHLVIKKAAGSYTHHGLGLGNNRVIHYSGLADGLVADWASAGVIEEVSVDDFAQGKEIIIKDHTDRKFKGDEAIIRARLRLGEAQYHVLHNNCEHLVEWCINGKHLSQQSRRGKLAYSAGMGARALIGVKNPVGFLAGAAAGYVYINHQGLKKVPDFVELEKAFEQALNAKDYYQEKLCLK